MAVAKVLEIITAGAVLVQARPSKVLDRRLDNGLSLKPPMGWDSYNHYACIPNSSIVESNAKALVDLGLADLGYHYVRIDTTSGRTRSSPHL